jgi:hypothetical protein
MRKHVLTLVLLFNSLLIFAQKELPEYGKIDKADLLLKECEFDKDAEAYKLLTFGDVRYFVTGGEFNIQTERRERVKILKEKGIDLANIKIRFYSRSGYENIKNIAAVTYNLDEAGNITTTKLEKSAIYIKKINNQISEVVFTMPEVKIGSVIEYKFTDIKKSIANLDDWYFQDDIPTRISMYKILVPSIFKFAHQLLAYQNVEQSEAIVHETAMIASSSTRLSYKSVEKSYIIRNVPALREEPYMGGVKDYLQRVVFQLSQVDYGDGNPIDVRSTWPKLSKELLDDEDFGKQLSKNLPHTKGLDDSLLNVKDDFQKMLLIHDYVRRNVSWNGNETIYSVQGIKSAWDKKTGTNSELNFILIDLLREAGLKAYPLLVSSKENGRVNTLYPFLQQFNGTMTCVFLNDKKFILDAADKYNPSNLVPYDVVNTEAFIVDAEKGGWITLANGNDVWKNVVSIFAEVTPDALMKGKATVYNYNYSKNPKVKKYTEDKTNYKDNFTKDYTGLKIEDLEVSNYEVDSLPLTQKVAFTLPLNSSGEYKYFTVNLFQGLEKNPFIADERVTDVEFNFRQSYTVVGKIFIPEDYVFEGLPKNMKMIMPDSSIILQRLIQPGENSIDFRINVDFVKPYYAAGNYPLLHEFYKKLFSALNEQIVIKKKPTS